MSCLSDHSRCGVPTAPRKYLVVTMFAARLLEVDRAVAPVGHDHVAAFPLHLVVRVDALGRPDPPDAQPPDRRAAAARAAALPTCCDAVTGHGVPPRWNCSLVAGRTLLLAVSCCSCALPLRCRCRHRARRVRQFPAAPWFLL